MPLMTELMCEGGQLFDRLAKAALIAKMVKMPKPCSSASY